MDATQYRRPESVLVVVYTDAFEVLLIERVRPSGFWQSVTGSMEWPDELPETCARRELLEETGIDPAAGALEDWQRTERFEIKPAWRQRFGPDVTHNTEHFFSFRLPATVPVVLNPCEHVAWRWAPLDEASATLSSWTNRKALTAIVERGF